MGVKVKVLTGDNGLVTEKVCRDVGLDAGRIVTGAELSGLSPGDFSKTVQDGNVFVKLSPAQKEQIVKQLRENGHVVGFMGDGINDAPAMKAADVGISVDSAVDVAKEAADIVLLEKSLLVLEEGIMEGRKVFANIVKYIRMGASSNFGNMFSVVGASYLLPFLPMQPVQILTNNLLYDFSQTGIPTDNVDAELITRPLKWNIGNIKRFMVFIGPISSIFDYATFALMWFFFHCSAFLDPATGADAKRIAGEALSDRMVRGVLADPDIDRSYHQDAADTVLRKSRLPAHDPDNPCHHGHRVLVAVLAFRGRFGDGSTARGLLGLDSGFSGDIRRVDPFGEDLVLQPLWR